MEVTIIGRVGEIGEYEVRPKDGQWVAVLADATNTNTNSDVRPPDGSDFDVLAGSTQLERTYYKQGIGGGRDYEVVGDHPEFEEGDGFNIEQNDEYYDPPSELVPDATASGYIYYPTDADTALDDLSNHNQVRATWE